MVWDYVIRLDNVFLFQIVATIVAAAAYLAARITCNRAIDRLVRSRQRLHPRRVASTRRAVSIIAIALLFATLAVVWSVDFRSLAVASGAILAALGIAFFAQWSVLSNVTTSIIMFWRFPIHIGDRIGLLSDKSFSGIVTDLTPFFIVIEDDEGNTVTIPNTSALQQAFVIYNPQASDKTPRQARIPAASAGGRPDEEDIQDAIPRFEV